MTDGLEWSIVASGSARFERARGTVQALHNFDPLLAVGARVTEQQPLDVRGEPDQRASAVTAMSALMSVLWCDFVDSALILGSRQHDNVIDRHRLAAADLGLARRRSGGGAVLAVPGSLIWVDLIVGSSAVTRDVRRSMMWAGDIWRRSLERVGVDGRLTVYQGPLTGDAWGERVCFAGLGPGEVLADGRKLVGLSQRRTRNGARISGALHVDSLLDDTADLLARPIPHGRPPTIATAAVDVEQLVAALASELTSELDSELSSR